MRIIDWISDVCSSDLFACRDLLGIRAPLDRGRGKAHLHGRLHLYALAGVAEMIAPLVHLRQFQRVVDLFGPPLPARLQPDCRRRSPVALALLRPPPPRVTHPRIRPAAPGWSAFQTA